MKFTKMIVLCATVCLIGLSFADCGGNATSNGGGPVTATSGTSGASGTSPTTITSTEPAAK